MREGTSTSDGGHHEFDGDNRSDVSDIDDDIDHGSRR